MQKNLSAYAPASIPTLEVATQDGKRVVRYPVCDDRETLLWFANQRAVEYHPTLFRGLLSTPLRIWSSTSTRLRAPMPSRAQCRAHCSSEGAQ